MQLFVLFSGDLVRGDVAVPLSGAEKCGYTFIGFIHSSSGGC